MKENRWKDVLRNLEPALEPEPAPDAEAPVRAWRRYIASDPMAWITRVLSQRVCPFLGSGEIESAHRYVFQKPLKIAGAWWKAENLAKMVALRVLRANRGWQDYWSGVGQKAA
jgi:hypothetical protein